MISRPINIVTPIGLHDIDTPGLHHVSVLNTFGPPDSVWMRPDKVLLSAEESASVEAVRMEGP